MSDLLSPAVGGIQPLPAVFIALSVLSLWGSGSTSFQFTYGAPGVRGIGWLPSPGAPQGVWASAIWASPLLFVELALCSLGSLFFGWTLLVGVVCGGFLVALLDLGAGRSSALADFGSSVSWGIFYGIVFFNLLSGLIRLATVFCRISVNYLVGGILMGMFLGGMGGLGVSVLGALFIPGLLCLGAGVLLYELGVTYFQLGLFIFLNGEYSAEAWARAAGASPRWAVVA